MLLLLLLLSFSISAQAILNKWDANNFCKCICFQSNYTILHMSLPEYPTQPCLSCTKQWCLNQNLPICAGASLGLEDINPDTATGKEGDVEARCFQRNSPRDQAIVSLFVLLVFGLLLGAGIKNRMEKAGFSWNRGVTWWEHLRSRMPVQEFSLSRLESSDDRNGNNYIPVSNDLS
ncbi:hypothetical protein D9757_002902 [Collybiopsis confluens]|uniref:Transmembrane protein n=1 Tax=Collybiopsis confluens TaxID=2823264 RepID=A0A8H5MDT7_9AGAR|nr:hypothetical protein D9757_002902 [Collybiopsis confluens]